MDENGRDKDKKKRGLNALGVVGFVMDPNPLLKPRGVNDSLPVKNVLFQFPKVRTFLGDDLASYRNPRFMHRSGIARYQRMPPLKPDADGQSAVSASGR